MLTLLRRLKSDPPTSLAVVVLSFGEAAEVWLFEAIGVSPDGHHLCVVDEAVDHGGGHDVAAEDFAPASEGLVAGHDPRGSFVAVADQLVEQVGGFGLEGDEADFVDDQQGVTAASPPTPRASLMISAWGRRG